MSENEIIYSYTDADAVEDGVLVRLGPTNRITANLFNWMAEHMPGERLITVRNVLNVLDDWIKRHGETARHIYDENLRGGIWVGLIAFEGNRWTDMEPDAGESAKDTPTHVRIWMIPNELGGLTLMFPEDY